VPTSSSPAIVAGGEIAALTGIPSTVMNLSTWIMAARVRTLSLSMTPVAVGAALAWAAEGQVRWLAIVVALVGSMSIQIGTNLHNDAVDSERGGDGPDRVGPPRVTAAGLLNGGSVKRGAAACFAVATLTGLYLAFVGGWPILLLGILSILSGWAYTGGPLPVAYTPLGELFVLAFFGVGAVCGTYWLCAGRLGYAAVVGGLAIGLFAAAVLMVNNHRDAAADARSGRKTLAIKIGPDVAVWVYAGLMLIPFAMLPLLGNSLPRGHVWPTLPALPPALALIYRFAREPPGRGFNRILAQTAQVQLMFGLLLCLGLVL
jgi:1,4-dihydroxy-2-naphthoate polyprenyltransferase